MDHPQIFAKAFNTPLLVDMRKAQAFVSGFGQRLFGAAPEIVGGLDALPDATYRTAKPFASLLDNSLSDRIRESGHGYAIRDGVAVVPVTGVLVHRGAWLGRSSGQTSYEGLAAQVEAAAEDSRVQGIALEIDSFGGEVAGCFGLASLIREVREHKPVQAFVAEHAFSAGYALASQAGRVILPATGGVGSIGVICMHADYSGALDASGIKVTIISAGAHKADGNPYAPLPDEVRERISAEMEALRGMFAAEVGKGRGSRLDASAARATEARSFMGDEAVAAGLADEVAEPRSAFEAFVAEIQGGASASLTRPRVISSREGPQMKDDDKDETAPEEQISGGDDVTEDDEDQPTNGASASSERQRIAAIFALAEADGQDRLARHLAFETELGPDACAGILKAAAQGVSGGALAAAMAGDDTDIDTPEAGAPKGPRAVDAVKKRYQT